MGQPALPEVQALLAPGFAAFSPKKTACPLPSRPGFWQQPFCFSWPCTHPSRLLWTGAPQAGTAGLWLVPVAAWGDKLGRDQAGQGVAVCFTAHPEWIVRITCRTQSPEFSSLPLLPACCSARHSPGARLSSLEPWIPPPAPAHSQSPLPQLLPAQPPLPHMRDPVPVLSLRTQASHA